jgi:hypothetical protein
LRASDIGTFGSGVFSASRLTLELRKEGGFFRRPITDADIERELGRLHR